MDEDNLREILGVSSAYQEEKKEIVEVPPPVRIEPVGDGRILGMTAPQRLVMAALLFVLTGLLGTLVLVIANKMAFPF